MDQWSSPLNFSWVRENQNGMFGNGQHPIFQSHVSACLELWAHDFTTLNCLSLSITTKHHLRSFGPLVVHAWTYYNQTPDKCYCPACSIVSSIICQNRSYIMLGIFVQIGLVQGLQGLVRIFKKKKKSKIEKCKRKLINQINQFSLVCGNEHSIFFLTDRIWFLQKMRSNYVCKFEMTKFNNLLSLESELIRVRVVPVSCRVKFKLI